MASSGDMLGVISLLDRFCDSLAGAGAEESLLVISQHDFPCRVFIAVDQRKGDLVQHPLAVPKVFFDVNIPVADGVFVEAETFSCGCVILKCGRD